VCRLQQAGTRPYGIEAMILAITSRFAKLECIYQAFHVDFVCSCAAFGASSSGACSRCGASCGPITVVFRDQCRNGSPCRKRTLWQWSAMVSMETPCAARSGCVYRRQTDRVIWDLASGLRKITASQRKKAFENSANQP
jgi:hypothetical protein